MIEYPGFFCFVFLSVLGGRLFFFFPVEVRPVSKRTAASLDLPDY